MTDEEIDCKGVISALDALTRNGELRDYDDELANRLEDAKEIVKRYTALSSAGRLVGDATFDPETRGTNVGSLPPLTAAQGGSISVTRVALAAAPHPAPDATAKREVERGRFVIDDPAPDATDWKALCGAAVMERNAAQAENEKLRAELAQCRKSAEVTERLHDGLLDENEKLRAALSRLLLEFDFLIEAGKLPDVRNDIIFVEARAALSPPPLHPSR